MAARETRKGFSVRGVHFDSPDAADRAADRLELEADEGDSIRDLRRQGRDAEADKRADQLRSTAAAYRTAASEHRTTPSPKPRRSSSTTTRRKSSSSQQPEPGQRSGERAGAQARVAAGQTTRLVSAAAGPVGGAVSEFVLATIAVAFLTVFLSSSRGPSGFAWLANGVAKLVHLIVAPVDPLAGVSSAKQGTPANPSAFAGAGGLPPALVTGGARPPSPPRPVNPHQAHAPIG